MYSIVQTGRKYLHIMYTLYVDYNAKQELESYILLKFMHFCRNIQ